MSKDCHNQEVEVEDFGFLAGFFKNMWWFLSIAGTIIALLVWTFFIGIVSVIENMFGYKRKKTIDEQYRVIFWNRVYTCLLEFHGFTAERAEKAVIEERKAIVPLIYYRQPFDVANEIAGFDVRLSQQDWEERYVKKILGKK